MSLFIGICIVVILAAAVAVRIKTDIANTLATVLLFIVCLLYITSLAGLMHIGYYFILALCVFCTGYLLYPIFKQRNFGRLKPFYSPAIIVLSTLLAYSLWRNSGSYVEEWDACVFWYWNYRVTLDTNALYMLSPNGISYINHPPFLPTMQYFFSFGTDGKGSGLLYTASNMLAFCCVLPVFAKQKLTTVTSRVKFLVSCLLLMLILNAFSPPGIRPLSTLMSDYYLAVLFGFGLFSVFDTEKNPFHYTIDLALVVAALSLLRVNGIFFAIVIVVLAGVLTLKRNNKSPLSAAVLSLFVFYGSWSIVIRLLNKSNSASTLSLKGMINALLRKGTQFENDVISAFVKALFTNENIGIGDISALVAFIIMVVAVIAIYFFHPEKSRRILSALCIIPFFYCLYLLFVMGSYLTSFSSPEALSLASYSRYTVTFPFAVLIFLFLYFSQKYTGLILNEWKSIGAVILLSILFITALPKEQQRIRERMPIAQITKDIAPLIKDIDPGKTPLLVIAAEGDNLNYYVRLSQFRYPYSVEKLGVKSFPVENMVKDETFADYLRDNFDYLYLYYPPEEFFDNYGDLFFPADISIIGLYRINKSKDGYLISKAIGALT